MPDLAGNFLDAFHQVGKRSVSGSVCTMAVNDLALGGSVLGKCQHRQPVILEGADCLCAPDELPVNLPEGLSMGLLLRLLLFELCVVDMVCKLMYGGLRAIVGLLPSRVDDDPFRLGVVGAEPFAGLVIPDCYGERNLARINGT